MRSQAKRALAALVVLAGCTVAPSDQAKSSRLNAAGQLTGDGPADAAPGTCWAKSIQPAILENMEQTVLVVPPQTDETGEVLSPAIYRKELRPKIVQERQETWFETPCDEVLTEEFIASLQRALAARGWYNGPTTGVMDAATRSAVRRFQEPDGIESGEISMSTARKLGLVAIKRE